MGFFAPNVDKLREKKDVPGLIKALAARDTRIRDAAAFALGELGDARAVDLFLAALRSSHSDARLAAVTALGKVRDERAAEPLITALGDQYERIRQRAVEALAGMGDPRAERALIAALQDKDGAVRQAAAQALGPRAEPIRAVWRQGQQLDSFGPAADAAFRDLFAALESDDPYVRSEAARLLADAPSAARRLVAIYTERRFSDPRRAALAARVLGRKLATLSDDAIPAEIAQLKYGLPMAFILCSCAHCGYFNKGIPAPPRGPVVPYYSQKKSGGAHSVPVLCDECGKEFFVVWDRDPAAL